MSVLLSERLWYGEEATAVLASRECLPGGSVNATAPLEQM